MSDRASPQHTAQCFVLSDHHCTHLAHRDQLSLILSWTGPHHLLNIDGRAFWTCPVVAHVGVESMNFYEKYMNLKF